MVQVMKTAWSVMWNVTDETPANSERFLDKNGMEVPNSFMNIFVKVTKCAHSPPQLLTKFSAKVFLQCKEAFPDTIELLRNMMGLLGNIAEVSH